MPINNFIVKDRLKITNIKGNTTVVIISDGEYEVAESSSKKESRQRAITLADTGKAIFSKSPQGQNRTLKITLPCTEASEEEFYRQTLLIFEQMRNRKKELPKES